MAKEPETNTMVRIKGQITIPRPANKAEKAPLLDSYRPAGHESQAEPQYENWRPGRAESRTHARVDSYRPDNRSNGLETGESYRPGHSLCHSYRPEQDLNNTRLYDCYRPGQHSKSELQADTYRPNYDTRERNTSSQSKSSTPFTSQVCSYTFSFGEPATPPPSPEIAAMDVEMDELLITTSMLTVENEQLSESAVELTQELLLKGLPVAIASLYASDKNLYIPVHRKSRLFDTRMHHSGLCKKCGRLQPIDLSKRNRRPNPHTCRGKAGNYLTTERKAGGGWWRVLKDVEARGWKLGPGPNEEPDSKRYLGLELCDATPDAGPPSSSIDLPWGRPDNASLSRKGKKGPNRTKAITSAQKEKDAEREASRATVDTLIGEDFGLSKKERAKARARALDTVRGQSAKQDTNNVMTQQALPAFDLRDLGKQLESLSSATTDVQLSMLT